MTITKVWSTWEKDPTAKLDYSIDWTAFLADDTISTSVWAVPSGITKVSDTHANGITTIWLSGGTVDTDYDVSNTITTADGRIDKRTILIRVRSR